MTEKKSVKTGAMGHRGIAIHQTLREIGFDAFLEYRRKSGSARLFPDFAQAKDDAAWSKAFSKHFTRFRTSLGVIRNGVGSIRFAIISKMLFGTPTCARKCVTLYRATAKVASRASMAPATMSKH